MKRVMALILLAIISMQASAQVGYIPSEENIKAREEFAGERFGIFIHWGIYSMFGHGEWALQTQGLNHYEYRRMAQGFYPSKFDAQQWVKAIKDSGAKYVTFTSRHHDGFSMFDTKTSDYDIVDGTPFKRDIVGELAQACHDQGINLHLYYSHLDWGRTDYWPLGRTGLRTGRPAGKEGDWQHYQKFMDDQLTELLTQYGPISCIWFDGVWDKDAYPREDQPGIWGLYHQYELIHSLQPGCLVGNNHHLVPFDGEDIQIFERDVPGDNTAGYSGENGISTKLPLETCQTMNESWGYRMDDKKYKSVDELIRLLVRTSGKGANLLLNIGPRPDGTLPEEALERLTAMGQWLKRNGEAIYGTQAGDVPEQSWGVTTKAGDRTYVHVLSEDDIIFLPMTGKKVKTATSLDGTVKIPFTSTKEGILLTVKDMKADGPDKIIMLK